MNVPTDLWRVRVDKVQVRVAVPDQPDRPMREIIEHYLANVRERVKQGAGMYLSGPSGIGKSSLAVLILKEARAWGCTGYFTGVWELRENIRSRVMFDPETTLLDRCREVDVLVLDRLRAEDAKDTFLDSRTLEELIAYRSGRLRPTIITTLLSPTELRGKMPGLADTVDNRLVILSLTGECMLGDRGKELNELVMGSAPKRG